MPALNPDVEAYIDRVVADLTTGSDLGDGLTGAAQNFALARDVANIFELFSEAMAGSAEIVVVNGDTTSIEIANGPSAGSFDGATVTFADDTTTAALQGVSATVLSNSGNIFTLSDELPASPVVGDEFTITGSMFSASVAVLRNGNDGQGNSPYANVYGYNRTVYDAMQRFHEVEGTTIADVPLTYTGALTGSGSTDSAVVTATSYRPDQFKKMIFAVGGEERTIVSHDENTFNLNKALSSAPAADTSYTISRRLYQVNQTFKHTVHPGGHPDNSTLASNLDGTKDLVIAFTVPS